MYGHSIMQYNMAQEIWDRYDLQITSEIVLRKMDRMNCNKSITKDEKKNRVHVS